MSRLTGICISLCTLLATPANAADPTPLDHDLRVYALDCGRAQLTDASVVSDTGEFDGRPLALANPCFLIHHPRGWLLWDAGLAADARSVPGLQIEPGPSLSAQIRALGVEPDALDYLAFSHMHFDHVGNANAFVHATWILNRDELAWAEHAPAHISMNPALFSAYHQAHTRVIEGDYDVFGDGRVRILKAPGHTPGSAVLWIGLKQPGPIVLSGDLYISREMRDKGYVAAINADRADTLASIARVERVAKRTHARMIVQHDPADYAALPKPPAYLY